MPLRILCAIACLAMATPAFAQISADIKAPKKSPKGELVELTTHIDADSSILHLRPRPEKLTETFTKTGDRVYIWLPTHPCYEVELEAWKNIDGKVDSVLATHKIEITEPEKPNPQPTPTPPGPNPQPGPQPGPTPPPGPPTPPPTPEPANGRFEVAKPAYAAGRSVNRPAECAALGAAFREVASRIRAEKLSPPAIVGVPLVKKGVLQTATAKAIPPSSADAWRGASDILTGQIKRLYGEGKLPTPNDWADAFDEIALGLEAASKAV